MREFNTPVSEFRNIIKKAGDKPLAFEYEGILFQISSTYGETDLLPCFKHFKMQSGFYALCSPREHPQDYVEIIYQCSYCDHMRIRKYDIQKIRNYSKEEIEFVGRLINEVLVNRSSGDQLEYEKRKKIDIWKKRKPVSKEVTPTPHLRKILRPGANDDLKIEYGTKRYEIASLFGETNLVPCPNKCYLQRGIYAVISPETEEQPFIKIIYQCDVCEDILVKGYDIGDLYQYSEDEYNFIVLMVRDIFMKRAKLGELEMTKRRKIDIIVDKNNQTYQILSDELKLD